MQYCPCGHLLRSAEEHARLLCIECRIQMAIRSRNAYARAPQPGRSTWQAGRVRVETSQHAIATDATRQAIRDCTWEDDDELDNKPFAPVLSRKQLKRDAWHKAAAYARKTRRRYAMQ